MNSKTIDQISAIIDKAFRNMKAKSDYFHKRDIYLSSYLEKHLKPLGFSPFHKGISRLCFIDKDKAVILKVEYGFFDSHGNFDTEEADTQTKNEINLSRAIFEHGELSILKDYILKPIAYDSKKYRWILFPKAYVHQDAKDEYERNRFKAYGIELSQKCLFIEDIHYDNIGFHEGKPIIVDFGNISPDCVTSIKRIEKQ